MRAVVLAAGQGTRLKPLTDRVPKPLLQLGGRSILEQNLAWLGAAGVTHVAINLHHQGDAIRQAIGDGQAFGLSVQYSEEPELLGTAGGTRRAAPLLPETWPLLVVYGDNLISVNLGRMLSRHERAGAGLTIAVYQVDDVRSSGVAEFDGSGRISRFIEKPPGQEGERGWVNAGLYFLERSAFELIPDGYSDFGHEIIPRYLAAGHPAYAYQLSGDERVFPIDTPEYYREASARLARYHKS
jgi:NDP-sugar pyrophosphorylase family protein